MRDDLTAVILVLDKSGSMQAVKDETIGSFNEFLEQQKKLPGDVLFTLTFFDTLYKIIHKNVPIKDVPPLDGEKYMPGGYTALRDAVCRSIDEVGAELSAMPEEERPGKVIMVILTDGQENSSREYSHEQLKKKISTQKGEFNWEFVYLGADPNSFDSATSMGISPRCFAAYDGTRAGTKGVIKKMDQAVACYRASGNLNL